jgi:hypothetical protein
MGHPSWETTPDSAPETVCHPQWRHWRAGLAPRSSLDGRARRRRARLAAAAGFLLPAAIACLPLVIAVCDATPLP